MIEVAAEAAAEEVAALAVVVEVVIRVLQAGEDVGTLVASLMDWIRASFARGNWDSLVQTCYAVPKLPAPLRAPQPKPQPQPQLLHCP